MQNFIILKIYCRQIIAYFQIVLVLNFQNIRLLKLCLIHIHSTFAFPDLVNPDFGLYEQGVPTANKWIQTLRASRTARNAT